jgi:molecular chaperone GrpE
MTEPKHHSHKHHPGSEAHEVVQPAEGSPTPGMETAPRPDVSKPDVLHLEAKLAEAEAKVAENLDGWQRAVAEFQNYKKRIERDREADQILMKGDLIRRFLPILDDLERALQTRPPDDAWGSGIELIERKLRSILEAEGVKRIEAQGALFDPNFHEAISQEPVDGVESGRVVAVVQNGYMLGERVIRPAQVRIAQ